MMSRFENFDNIFLVMKPISISTDMLTNKTAISWESQILKKNINVHCIAQKSPIVWCTISSFVIVGPIIGALTVNSARYERLINDFLSGPSRSPNLTPPDFFLWGYLKSHLYDSNPSTIFEFKENIRREINNISTHLLRCIFKNIRDRFEECQSREGRHLNNTIFICFEFLILQFNMYLVSFFCLFFMHLQKNSFI